MASVKCVSSPSWCLTLHCWPLLLCTKVKVQVNKNGCKVSGRVTYSLMEDKEMVFYFFYCYIKIDIVEARSVGIMVCGCAK